MAEKSWTYITTRAEFIKACAILSAYAGSPDCRIACDLETYVPPEAYETACRIQSRKDPMPFPIWEGRFWLGKARLVTAGTCPINAPYQIRGKQFIFDVWALGEELICAGLKHILETAPIIGHNFGYDYGFLRSQFGVNIPRDNLGCTMLFNQALNAGNKAIGSKLYECYYQHIPEDIFRSITNQTFQEYIAFKTTQQVSNWQAPVLDEKQKIYAAEDTLLIHWVHEHQVYTLQNWRRTREVGRRQDRSLATIVSDEFALLPTVAMMRLRGAPFDSERHNTVTIPFLVEKKEEFKRALWNYPEFQKIPEIDTCKIILKLKYTERENINLTAAQIAADIRKRLAPEFSKLSYTQKILSSQERDLLYQTFLARAGNSKINTKADLARNKLAEYENELKRVLFVSSEKELDGNEIHILWRTNTVPSVTRDMCLAVFQDLVPEQYEILPFEPININSPDQLGQSLFKRFGEIVESTEAKVLKKYKAQDPEIVLNILDYKSIKDSLSKSAGLLDCATSRGFIHSELNQMGSDRNGVSTGRWSSNGPNLQNIQLRKILCAKKSYMPIEVPEKEIEKYYDSLNLTIAHKEVIEVRGVKLWEIEAGVSSGFLFRESFRAPPGFVLVDADYSQIEPCITAQITGDPGYIKALREGSDLHGLTAKACLSLDYIPIKGSFERDFIGKTMNLAISYGIGAYALSVFLFQQTDGRVDVNKEEAQIFIDGYFDMYPKIKEMMDEVYTYISELPARYGSFAPFKGHKPFSTIIAECGRIRHFALTPEMENMEDKYLRADWNPSNKRWYWNEFKKRLTDCGLQAYNTLVQGLAASIFKKATIAIDRIYEKQSWNQFNNGLCLAVHDELMGIFEEKYAEEAAHIMKTTMITVGEDFITKVPVKVSINISKSWWGAH